MIQLELKVWITLFGKVSLVSIWVLLGTNVNLV